MKTFTQFINELKLTNDPQLVYYARKRNLDKVKELLKNGVNPNSKDDESFTALMRAARNNDLDMFKELIKYGADTNAKNRNGYTALIYALTGDSLEIFKELFKDASDLTIKDGYGHMYYDHSHGEIRQWLNSKGIYKQWDKVKNEASTQIPHVNYTEDDSINENIQFIQEGLGDKIAASVAGFFSFVLGSATLAGMILTPFYPMKLALYSTAIILAGFFALGAKEIYDDGTTQDSKSTDEIKRITEILNKLDTDNIKDLSKEDIDKLNKELQGIYKNLIPSDVDVWRTKIEDALKSGNKTVLKQTITDYNAFIVARIRSNLSTRFASSTKKVEYSSGHRSGRRASMGSMGRRR